VTPKAAVSAAIIAAVAAGLVLADGGSGATAYERFPEYESVQEVPVVGSLDSHAPRLGAPPRSAVRLAAHYLRISQDASNVRCHGVPGNLIVCRVHLTGLGATIVARVALTPKGRFRDLIAGCETTRLINGRLSEAPCFDFTYSFNKWQAGPPQIANVDPSTRPRGKAAFRPIA
jgi:hypothetical protein